jgi:hypothetical protein
VKTLLKLVRLVWPQSQILDFALKTETSTLTYLFVTSVTRQKSFIKLTFSRIEVDIMSARLILVTPG